MFDARSILDILLGGPGVRGGRPGQPVNPKAFKDMLDQLGDQGSPPAAGQSTSTGAQPVPGGRWTEQRYPQAPEQTTGPQSLEDLLRGILTGAQQQDPAGGRPAPGGPMAAPEVGEELRDLLRQILQGGQGGQGGASGGATRIPSNKLTGDAGEGAGQTGEPGLAETLRRVLGQATAGMREGAERIDEATGLSGRAREAVGQTTGQSPEELVAKLKELIASNQLAAGAALGGLGALVLGTSAGRSLASAAVKLGGLALVGGLAYKAYQNYQQGRPVLSSGEAKQAKAQTLLPAPDGSGFESRAMTHGAAQRCIRAMIAAAAADGRIDMGEQQRILGSLQQAGLDDAAQQFLAAEITSPATVDELASGVASPEEAVQVYTAARVAVDPRTNEEHAFLSALAEALGIDDDLAGQVDAAARGTAA
jgi:uncharacterized membrane protein YebE (DUF533 family)